MAGDEWFLDSLTKAQVIPAFEKQTSIHVEVLHKNDRTIMSDLDRGAQPGDSGLDVVVMRHRLLGALVQKGQVRPIDSFLADPSLHDPSFVPQELLFPNWWRELSSYGNHIYGYPYIALTTFLCYRKDLLNDPANQRNFKLRYHRELKPPTTWQEYTLLAEFFTRPGEHFYGTHIQGKQGLALWYEWLNLIHSFGGNILDAQHGWEYGDIVVNSPQNVAATERVHQADCVQPARRAQFRMGRGAVGVAAGTCIYGAVVERSGPHLEDPAVSKVAGKIGYSLIPLNSAEPFSQLEGLTYLIPQESTHPREAYRFLEWVMSAQVQDRQTLRGGLSVSKSTYDKPEVKQLRYASTFLASVPIAN